MSGPLDTTIHGDPVAAQATAAGLEQLAAALSSAHASLTTQSRGSESVIGGLAGTAYRAQAGRLAHACGTRRAQSEGLSRGLLALADELGACLSAMHGVCERARRDLRVSGPIIHPPVEGPDGMVEPPALAAWRAACGEVSDVRRREGAAQAAWQDTMHRWASTPWPTTAAGIVGTAVGSAGAAGAAGSGPPHHHHHGGGGGGVTAPVPQPSPTGCPTGTAPPSPNPATGTPHHHHHPTHLAIGSEPWVVEGLTSEPVLTVDPVITDQPGWPDDDGSEGLAWEDSKNWELTAW